MPTSGLGPVYDGAFHLLLSPEDLIPLVALAILCGQRGVSSARRALWLVPVAWFTGGLAGMYFPGPPLPTSTAISFLVLGVLVAADVQIPVAALSAVAVLVAVLHGYLNGIGINPVADGIYTLLGLAVAVSVLVALIASLVISLRRPWMRIAVRVAGSWIAASGLLLVGWALRGAH
jgi:hydrogenase/urease accessory protein HupE